jgi:hypothetical protein
MLASNEFNCNLPLEVGSDVLIISSHSSGNSVTDCLVLACNDPCVCVRWLSTSMTILMTIKAVAARKATTGPAKSLRTTASISHRFSVVLGFSRLADGYSCATSVIHLEDTLVVLLFCELSHPISGYWVLMLSCTR